jgi:hypothetical protein
VDFLKETIKVRRAWNDVFQSQKESSCEPAKLSFIIDEEMKTFYDKQKIKKFMTTKPALQKIFKGILYTEQEENATMTTGG